MVEILLVVNPYSGKKGKNTDEILPSLMQIASECGEVLCPENLDDLRSRFKELLKKKPRLVATFGGDGTVHHVVNLIFETLDEKDFPMLLPLQGGTMNCIADDVGTLGQADHVFQQVVKRLEHGHLPMEERGVLECKVKTKDGKKKQTAYGFTFGNGIAYKGLLEIISMQPTPVNVARLIVSGIFLSSYRNRIAGLEKMSIKLSANDFGEREFLGTLCSTLGTSVIGFKPFFQKISKPKKEFNFLSTTYTIVNLAPFFFVVFWALGRRFLDEGRYFNQLTESVTVESSSGFTLDGELFTYDEPNRVDLKVAGVLKIPKVYFGRKLN